MTRRVLVCGGRDYDDADYLNRTLDAAHAKEPISIIIHGAYRGADTLARKWANSRGVPHLPFVAPWKILGKAAGPFRNQMMIDQGKPDIVVAFPGNEGTADMIDKAYKAKIRVVDLRK